MKAPTSTISTFALSVLCLLTTAAAQDARRGQPVIRLPKTSQPPPIVEITPPPTTSPATVGLQPTPAAKQIPAKPEASAQRPPIATDPISAPTPIQIKPSKASPRSRDEHTSDEGYYFNGKWYSVEQQQRDADAMHAREAEQVKAKQEQERQLYAAHKQNELRYTGLFLIVLLTIIGFGAWKYPTPGIRTGGIMTLIGAAAFAGSFYVFYVYEYGSGMQLVTGMLWVTSGVIVCVGLAKVVIGFGTLPKSKTARVIIILSTGLGIIVLSALWLDAPSPDGSVSLPAVASLLTGVFTLIGGLIKASKGSSAADHTEEKYHGSARFATEDEIKELTIKRGEPLPAPGGFILAPPEPDKGRKGQVLLPRMATVQHGLILGGSGTGKSRGYFLPNCAQARDTSLVVTDPKSEL